MELNENYGDKLFCQDISDEMYRLELVSKTYDFTSQQQLKSLNLKPNARCLDIGSGSGSMVTWLAEQPELKNGEIVAMDQYINLLQERLPVKNNLKILQHDINTENDSIGQFDLVTVRFVLMHLRDRAALIKKISALVKPGGWLVISDIIDVPAEHSGNILYREVMATMWNVLINTIGTDKNWSHSLSSRFESLGYENIRKEIYYPSISHGSPMSEFWYLTWKEMHSRLIEVGKLQSNMLEKAENALLYGKVNDLSPGMLTCIGQKQVKQTDLINTHQIEFLN